MFYMQIFILFSSFLHKIYNFALCYGDVSTNMSFILYEISLYLQLWVLFSDP